MLSHLSNRLLRRRQQGNLRRLPPISESLIDFASNDYLGLARSPQLAASVLQEWQKHSRHLNGLGSTGSRLLTGNSLYAQELEEKIAEFHGFEAGVLFGCGYMANVGLLSTIADSESIILFDVAIHASTHDGIRLSRAQALPFRHNDPEHLESRLKRCHSPIFICVESIYSTDGSQAPLKEISQLANRYAAHLIVDEAHAVGICGPEGRGLIAENELNSYLFAQVITFGKAVGAYGAIILGSRLLKEALINFAKPFIYTTALPLHALAAIKCSYELFPKMEKERQHLCKLIDRCNKVWSNSRTPIQPLPVEGNQRIKEIAHVLANYNFDVRPLMSPTVQKGHEVLRICLHAFNKEEELAQLIECIQNHEIFCHA